MALFLAWTIIVLLGALNCWTDRMNALFFFGRTVPAEVRSTAAAHAITRRYLKSVALSTLGCASLLLPLHLDALRVRHHPLYSVAILLQTLLCFRSFAEANRRARMLQQQAPATIGRSGTIEVDLTAAPSYWVPGLLASLLPLIVAALAFATAAWFSGSTTWAARCSAWTDRLDRHGMVFLFGMATGMLAAGTVLLLLLRSVARLRTRMAQYTVRWSFALAWSAAGMMLLIFAATLRGAVLSRGQSREIQAAIFCVTLGLALWNQRRARTFVPAPVELGADDRWRWGLFYVDRNDPALFVQSRCGAGYGLNYGKRIAWPILFAVCAYVIVVFLVLPLRH